MRTVERNNLKRCSSISVIDYQKDNVILYTKQNCLSTIWSSTSVTLLKYHEWCTVGPKGSSFHQSISHGGAISAVHHHEHLVQMRLIDWCHNLDGKVSDRSKQTTIIQLFILQPDTIPNKSSEHLQWCQQRHHQTCLDAWEFGQWAWYNPSKTKYHIFYNCKIINPHWVDQFFSQKWIHLVPLLLVRPVLIQLLWGFARDRPTKTMSVRLLIFIVVRIISVKEAKIVNDIPPGCEWRGEYGCDHPDDTHSIQFEGALFVLRNRGQNYNHDHAPVFAGIGQVQSEPILVSPPPEALGASEPSRQGCHNGSDDEILRITCDTPACCDWLWFCQSLLVNLEEKNNSKEYSLA